MQMPAAFTLIADSPALLYTTTALFGLLVGSFLNVVILRLPRMMEAQWREDCAPWMEVDQAHATPDADDATTSTPNPLGSPARHPSDDQADALLGGTGALAMAAPTRRLSLAWPPSSCPHCGTRIAPWDNIPVLSWLLLRGRCRACGGAISVRYPLVEGLTALLAVVVVWQFGPTWAGAAALLLTFGLIALAFIDLDTQLLPDSITLPLLWLGLLLSLGGLFTDSTDAIIGAVSGYLSLWLVFHGFRLLTGKEGMGRGDFKLLALFGAWLGWQVLPQVVLLSVVPGALVGIVLIATGRQQSGEPIPFGPFLAIAGWVALLWGPVITDAYLRWSGLAG